MSIKLDTPYHGFGEVKVTQLRLLTENKQLFVNFQYGDTVAGVWLKGDVVDDERLIVNVAAEIDGIQEVSPADPQYDIITGTSRPKVTFTDMSADPRWSKHTETHSVHGSLDMWAQISYVAVSDNLYQYALDKGWYQGVIL